MQYTLSPCLLAFFSLGPLGSIQRVRNSFKGPFSVKIKSTDGSPWVWAIPLWWDIFCLICQEHPGIICERKRYQPLLTLLPWVLGSQLNRSCSFLKNNFICLFFLAVLGSCCRVGFPVVAASRATLYLWRVALGTWFSVAVAHGLSCSGICGIFLGQSSNLCLLHWQADSSPLSHQG